MNSSRTISAPLAWLLGLALALGAPLALSACGDDDDGEGGDASEPAAIEMTVTDGQGGEPEFTLPEGIEAGVNEITLTNEGERPHSAQLLRTEGERTEDEVLEGLGAAMEGEAFPEWFFAGGGVGTVEPGQSATVTQALEPESTYWLVDDEAQGRPPLEELGTTGADGEAEIEPTDNVVTAVDFGFEADTLTADEAITLENEGEEPHHMVAAPMNEDATIEDVEQFLQTEEGEPPIDFEGEVSTSVLEGGTSQISAAEFAPGRYALLCFISNREGGPPHVELGMIDEVEVE